MHSNSGMYQPLYKKIYLLPGWVQRSFWHRLCHMYVLFPCNLFIPVNKRKKYNVGGAVFGSNSSRMSGEGSRWDVLSIILVITTSYASISGFFSPRSRQSFFHGNRAESNFGTYHAYIGYNMRYSSPIHSRILAGGDNARGE
jgi:hypothetical protein